MIRVVFAATAPGIYRFTIGWPTDGVPHWLEGYVEPADEKFAVHNHFDNVRLLSDEHAEQVRDLVWYALERDVRNGTRLHVELLRARLAAYVRLAPMMAPRPTTYLVMDETDESPFKDDDGRNGNLVFAFVGVAIPIEKAERVRISLYQFMHRLYDDAGRDKDEILTSPPELHGMAMFPKVKYPWVTDEHRVQCFAKVVEVINSERLDVYRAAVFRRSATLFESTKVFLTHGWESLMRIKAVDRLRASSFVVPMIDGVDRDAFSGVIGPRARFMDLLRSGSNYGVGPIHIQHTDSLLDPVFVESEHSVLMQLTDVVAYLLKVWDWEYRKWELPPFKAKLLPIAKALNPELLHGHMGDGYEGIAPQDLVGATKRP